MSERIENIGKKIGIVMGQLFSIVFLVGIFYSPLGYLGALLALLPLAHSVWVTYELYLKSPSRAIPLGFFLGSLLGIVFSVGYFLSPLFFSIPMLPLPIAALVASAVLIVFRTAGIMLFAKFMEHARSIDTHKGFLSYLYYALNPVLGKDLIATSKLSFQLGAIISLAAGIALFAVLVFYPTASVLLVSGLIALLSYGAFLTISTIFRIFLLQKSTTLGQKFGLLFTGIASLGAIAMVVGAFINISSLQSLGLSSLISGIGGMAITAGLLAVVAICAGWVVTWNAKENQQIVGLVAEEPEGPEHLEHREGHNGIGHSMSGLLSVGSHPPKSGAVTSSSSSSSDSLKKEQNKNKDGITLLNEICIDIQNVINGQKYVPDLNVFLEEKWKQALEIREKIFTGELGDKPKSLKNQKEKKDRDRDIDPDFDYQEGEEEGEYRNKDHDPNYQLELVKSNIVEAREAAINLLKINAETREKTAYSVFNTLKQHAEAVRAAIGTVDKMEQKRSQGSPITLEDAQAVDAQVEKAKTSSATAVKELKQNDQKVHQQTEEAKDIFSATKEFVENEFGLVGKRVLQIQKECAAIATVENDFTRVTGQKLQATSAQEPVRCGLSWDAQMRDKLDSNVNILRRTAVDEVGFVAARVCKAAAEHVVANVKKIFTGPDESVGRFFSTISVSITVDNAKTVVGEAEKTMQVVESAIEEANQCIELFKKYYKKDSADPEETTPEKLKTDMAFFLSEKEVLEKTVTKVKTEAAKVEADAAVSRAVTIYAKATTTVAPDLSQVAEQPTQVERAIEEADKLFSCYQDLFRNKQDPAYLALRKSLAEVKANNTIDKALIECEAAVLEEAEIHLDGDGVTITRKEFEAITRKMGNVKKAIEKARNCIDLFEKYNADVVAVTSSETTLARTVSKSVLEDREYAKEEVKTKPAAESTVLGDMLRKFKPAEENEQKVKEFAAKAAEKYATYAVDKAVTVCAEVVKEVEVFEKATTSITKKIPASPIPPASPASNPSQIAVQWNNQVEEVMREAQKSITSMEAYSQGRESNAKLKPQLKIAQKNAERIMKICTQMIEKGTTASGSPARAGMFSRTSTTTTSVTLKRAVTSPPHGKNR